MPIDLGKIIVNDAANSDKLYKVDKRIRALSRIPKKKFTADNQKELRNLLDERASLFSKLLGIKINSITKK